jgi:hypothetical protein
MPSQSDQWSQIPVELQGQVIPLPQDYQHPHISELLPPKTEPESRLYVYHGSPTTYSFQEMRAQMRYALRRTTPLNRGRWQTLDVSQSDQHDAHELRNVHVFYDVPETMSALRADVKPDLPWADYHFLERIGGEPLNPAPSYEIWPHHNGSRDRHVEDQVFSHTYPERFWPKYAGEDKHQQEGYPHQGVRFEYGDLRGVIDQLQANPLTRQAVLPVWFPEDTGATDRRVPCTLFYHFMADGRGSLDCWYSMRACDFHRHFHNDMYLAARLLQWVCGEVAGVHPGQLNVTISNLHLFRGDADKS